MKLKRLYLGLLSASYLWSQNKTKLLSQHDVNAVSIASLAMILNIAFLFVLVLGLFFPEQLVEKEPKFDWLIAGVVVIIFAANWFLSTKIANGGLAAHVYQLPQELKSQYLLNLERYLALSVLVPIVTACVLVIFVKYF